VCQNNRQVHRLRLEEALLQLVFEEVFSTEVVRYLTRLVDAALRRLTATQPNLRDRLQAELAHAKAQLHNVKQAILQGILTPTTREMLETCERRVADLEAQLRTPPKRTAPVALDSVIQTYLGDLRATLGTDVEAARRLLGKLIGKITLRQDGPDLVAEVGGTWRRSSGATSCAAGMVPGGGFEPPRVAPHAPQTCASARFRHPGTPRRGEMQRPQGPTTRSHYTNRRGSVSIAGHDSPRVIAHR
jgi:hypothetical protein